ncbi:hypothetical protein SAMN03159406_04729 [Rhizobium sp. NFR03]|nr:hypothetical protein SAMN03159406_04729 [Rhizobium sp. NFR03]
MSFDAPSVSRLAVAAAIISLAHPASAQTLDELTNKAKEVVAPITGQTDDRLQKVATFDHQVSGVTVSDFENQAVELTQGCKGNLV